MCNVIDSLRARHGIYFSADLLRGGSLCCPSCMPTLSLASLAYSPTSSLCCLDAIPPVRSRPGMLQILRDIVRQVRLG
jgi:hypothetical protein